MKMKIYVLLALVGSLVGCYSYNAAVKSQAAPMKVTSQGPVQRLKLKIKKNKKARSIFTQSKAENIKRQIAAAEQVKYKDPKLKAGFVLLIQNQLAAFDPQDPKVQELKAKVDQLAADNKQVIEKLKDDQAIKKNIREVKQLISKRKPASLIKQKLDVLASQVTDSGHKNTIDQLYKLLEKRDQRQQKVQQQKEKHKLKLEQLKASYSLAPAKGKAPEIQTLVEPLAQIEDRPLPPIPAQEIVKQPEVIEAEKEQITAQISAPLPAATLAEKLEQYRQLEEEESQEDSSDDEWED